MEVMYQWFNNNLPLIHLVYGLMFVVMGVSVFIQPKKNSNYKLAGILWLFVAYALTHAPADFIDVWDSFLDGASTFGPYSSYITYLSYVFQFEFGRRILKLVYPDAKVFSFLLLPLVLLAIYFLTFISGNHGANLDVAVGYLLRFPAGTMSGLGFILYYRKVIRPNNIIALRKYFYAGGTALICWAFLCGIIRADGELFFSSAINVPAFFDTFAVPVYVFRSICAVVLTISLTGILKIFNWEFQDKIIASNIELDRKVQERTEELESMVSLLNQEIKKNKQSERAILNHLSFQKSIINGIADSLIVIDNEYQIVMMNEKARDVFGISSSHGGKCCHEVIKHKDMVDCFNDAQCLLKRIRAIQSPLIEEHKIIGKTGDDQYLEIRATPLFDEKKRMKGIIEVMRDVTIRKNLEKEVLEISEKERNQIARELHDDLGQYLLGVDVMSRLILKKMRKNSRQSKNMGEIIAFIEKAIKLNRNIAHGLSPRDVTPSTFVSMVKQLLKNYEELFAVSCKFTVAKKFIVEDTIIGKQLYKIIQEGVKNSISHGSADIIDVKITVKGNEKKLMITDNGIGIEGSLGDCITRGLGLKIMQYRTDIMGGKILFSNGTKRGFSITVNF